MNCSILVRQPAIAFHSPLSKPSHIFYKHQLSKSSNELNLSFSIKTLKPKLICNAAGTGNWEKWLPRNMFSAEKVLKSISGVTSSPICQFISSPTTFLHSVDSRIKLAWLVSLVVLPARSNFIMRIVLLAFLTLLSTSTLPREVWMDQLGRVTLISGVLFIMLGFGADGIYTLSQIRSPPSLMLGLPKIPSSLENYSYTILKLGPFQLTKKGLALASTSACLTFTIFQSASLCLTTTTPEQLAFALQWFMNPLARFGVPVAEVILTLLLSLRFINLVFDEVRTVALGIVSRRINWELLTFMETSEIFFSYIRRIFKNIFSHAEQITQAMNVRGFKGDSNTHKIYFSSESSSGFANVLSLLCLVGIIGAATFSEYALV